MSAKAISEAKGKQLLNDHLQDEASKNRLAVVTESVNWDKLTQDHPWLLTEVIAFNVCAFCPEFVWDVFAVRHVHDTGI